jgi:ADP-heptose:LPS heptosyltransferase
VKILLVRLRLIGDVVFTTPVIRALRRRYPHARLDYLVEPAAAPIVTGNPHLNEVIVAPKPRGLGRLMADVRLARTLRSARYDIVIDLHGGPRSGWLTWASGAPRRIGYDIKGRGWM